MKTAVLVGCGAMARGWLSALRDTPALRDSVKIVGLVDLSASLAQDLAQEFDLGDVVIGVDLEQVLSQTSPDILFDVVVPDARKAVALAGLRHGCHVLSEKPMATSLQEAREILSAAQASNLTQAVVQNRRFYAGVRRIRAAIENRLIGDLTSLHCDFFLGPHFGGFREDMDHVLLLDMAIHTFDAARFMSGAAPRKVYCHETNPAHSWYKAGAAANAIFEMDDNVTFTYRGSWCAEGVNTSWESAWRFIGTKGSLIWDGEDEFVCQIVDGEDGFFHPLKEVDVPDAPDMGQTHGHASVISDFLNSLKTGTAPETAGTDNIKSLAMVLAAIESATKGARVNIID
ncbi:MAG: Gfo/Idh/MocA family protein [Marinosulfonomonas sp.]